MQTDHRLVVNREAPEGSFDHHPRLSSTECITTGGVGTCGDRVETNLLDAVTGTPDRPGSVCHNPMQPGLETISVPKHCQPAPRLDERVLNHVRRQRFSDDRNRQAIGRRRVCADKILECTDVSAPCPCDGLQVLLPPYVLTPQMDEVFCLALEVPGEGSRRPASGGGPPRRRDYKGPHHALPGVPRDRAQDPIGAGSIDCEAEPRRPARVRPNPRSR